MSFDFDVQCDESSDLSLFEAQAELLAEDAAEAAAAAEPTAQDWEDLADFQASLVRELDWLAFWAEIRDNAKC
jgi:hypothetical protein